MTGQTTTLPSYVFRGTTLGFQGSPQSVENQYTCTSANPAKASLFAKACQAHYFHNPVIYIAKTENLFALKRIFQRSRRMAMVEEECSWNVLPVEFYKSYSDGYITLEEMKIILENRSLYPVGSAKYADISGWCEKIPLTTVEKKTILAERSLYPSGSATFANISTRCERIPPLNVKVIENIVAEIKNSLKK